MLTETYKKEGVPLVDAFGTSYPDCFVHPAAEYRALVEHVGLLDLTHWSILRVTGRDRASFLNNMLTADIAALEPNNGAHALITTVKGKIIAELFVFKRSDDVLVIVAQGDATETLRVLEKHIIMEDVTVENVSSRFGVLALEGGGKVEDVLWRIFPQGPFPKESLQAYAREFGGIPIYLMGNSVTGDPGCHLLIPRLHIDSFRGYLVQACRGSDGLPVGRSAWNMRRVEHGLPWYGVDFTADHFPDEARLGHAVSYTKGCFRGQETLARLHHRGHVNWVLAGLMPDDTAVDHVATPLANERHDSASGVVANWAALAKAFAGLLDNYDEPALAQQAPSLLRALDYSSLFPTGTELSARRSVSERDVDGIAEPAGTRQKPAGHITSAVFSPMLGRPLFLARVRHELVHQEAPLRLGDAPVRIVELPLEWRQRHPDSE